MQQDENCMERDRDKPSKLQSSMYYALDGDQVNILIMLAQKCEDFWVRTDIFIDCNIIAYPRRIRVFLFV